MSSYYLRGTLGTSDQFSIVADYGTGGTRDLYVLVVDPSGSLRHAFVRWTTKIEIAPLVVSIRGTNDLTLQGGTQYDNNGPSFAVPMSIHDSGDIPRLILGLSKVPQVIHMSPMLNIPGILATGQNYTFSDAKGSPISFGLFPGDVMTPPYPRIYINGEGTSSIRLIPHKAFIVGNCSKPITLVNFIGNAAVPGLEVLWVQGKSVPDVFTTTQQCNSDYLYNYCTGTNTCSDTCYGNCSVASETCTVTGKNKMSCRLVASVDDSTLYLIIGGIILTVIFIFVILFIFSRSRSRHPTIDRS